MFSVLPEQGTNEVNRYLVPTSDGVIHLPLSTDSVKNKPNVIKDLLLTDSCMNTDSLNENTGVTECRSVCVIDPIWEGELLLWPISAFTIKLTERLRFDFQQGQRFHLVLVYFVDVYILSL